MYLGENFFNHSQSGIDINRKWENVKKIFVSNLFF